MTMTTAPATPPRIHEALLRCGVGASVRHLEASTRTVSDAARALDCAEAHIGKSIVLRTAVSDQPLLVIASGTNRISEVRISTLIGEAVVKADAAFVRHHTGFAIGGVPPFGHTSDITTILDKDLLQYEQIFVAAGTPTSILALTPRELCLLVPRARIEIVT